MMRDGEDRAITGVKWSALAPLLLALVTLAAYANSFKGAFLFDDFPNIVSNRRLQHPLDAMLNSTRPVVGLTLSANYLVGGRNPADYHLVNLIIHFGSVLLLYGLVRRTVERVLEAGGRGQGAGSREQESGEHATGNRQSAALAFVIAALWGVHPLQTESVTYIIQRAESLMGMFYLATLYCFVRFVAAEKGSHRWAMGAIVACALGMATKPIMVTAPLMVLLFDRWFVAGSFARAWRDRKAFYASLGCTWLVLGALVSAPNESANSAGFRADMEVTARGYLLTQPSVILHYLRLSLWPSGLCLDYGWPPATRFSEVWLSWVVIGALVAGTVWLSLRRHWLGFLGAWFFITLLPSSSVIPIADLVVEHRMYIPLAAVAAAVVGLGGMFQAALVRHGKLRRSFAGMLAGGIAIGLVSLLAVLTRERNGDYQSELTMWRDVDHKRPGNFRGRNSMISALLAEGFFAESERAANALIRDIYAVIRGQVRMETTPATAAYHFTGALNHLGRALMGQGRTQEALAPFEEAVKADPKDALSYHNLSVALVSLGKYREAEKVLDQVLALSPGFARGLALKGSILERRGRFLEAAALYQAALASEPDLLVAKRRLAWLESTCPDGRIRNGAKALRVALELCELTEWRSYRVLETLAAAYAESGKYEEAVQAQKEAISVRDEQLKQSLKKDSASGEDGAYSDMDAGSDRADMQLRLSCYLGQRPFRTTEDKE